MKRNRIVVCGGGGFIRNNKNNNTAFSNFEKNPMLANLVDIVNYSNKGFAVSSLNNAVIRTLDAGQTCRDDYLDVAPAVAALLIVAHEQLAPCNCHAN